MQAKRPEYEQPTAGSAWISSVERGAGIYFLEGRTHFAGHATPAERQLLERGALLVATVRFDRDPLEAFYPRRRWSALAPRAALGRLAGAVLPG